MKHRLEIKLFGAGRIYEGNIDVGARNTEWVLQFLKTEGYSVAKSDLGDVFPRKVYYFFPLFHIKDMDNTPEKSFAPVGTRIIDWKQVFKLAPKAGLDLFFVEQDTCTKMTALESIKVSFDNLRKLKL